MRVCDLTLITATPTTITLEATSPYGFCRNGKATMVLPLPLDDFKTGLIRWDRGAMVQEAFPTLNAVHREFLMTGINVEDQEKVFAEPVDNGNELEDEDEEVDA